MKRAVLFAVILSCAALPLSPAVLSCTIFNQSAGRIVLVGNNEDWYYSAPATVNFRRAARNEHGRVYFALYGYAQGGMNDAGLFIDSAVCPAVAEKKGEAPALGFAFWEKILAECANLGEALAMLQQAKAPITRADHFMLVDATGASAVAEWMDGALRIVQKQGSYQVITNFWLTRPEQGWYPCARYDKAREMLQKEGAPSLDNIAAILEAVSQDDGSLGTVYSNIYDLERGEVHTYYRRDFTRVITFNLAEELAKGNHTYDLAELFAGGRWSSGRK